MKTIYHKVRLSLKDRINFFFINTNDNLTYKKKKQGISHTHTTKVPREFQLKDKTMFKLADLNKEFSSTSTLKNAHKLTSKYILYWD